jgi:hypothetical protein
MRTQLQRVTQLLEALPGVKRRKRRVLAKPETHVTLQCGTQCFENAPRELRTQLWLSALHKGIGQTASQQYHVISQQVGRPIARAAAPHARRIGGRPRRAAACARPRAPADAGAPRAQPLPADAAADIDKDLDRTFPSTVQFDDEEGQQQLRRVLRAYAAYDPDVGYCQGMNFLAALLLMYLPREEDAFGALVMLMFEQGLRHLYSRSMVQLQVGAAARAGAAHAAASAAAAAPRPPRARTAAHACAPACMHAAAPAGPPPCPARRPRPLRRPCAGPAVAAEPADAGRPGRTPGGVLRAARAVRRLLAHDLLLRRLPHLLLSAVGGWVWGAWLAGLAGRAGLGWAGWLGWLAGLGWAGLAGWAGWPGWAGCLAELPGLAGLAGLPGLGWLAGLAGLAGLGWQAGWLAGWLGWLGWLPGWCCWRRWWPRRQPGQLQGACARQGPAAGAAGGGGPHLAPLRPRHPATPPHPAASWTWC